MRVVALFSGGKDSTFALHWAFTVGMDVVSLITFKVSSSDSLLFHIPCIDLAPLQAKAIGIPITCVPNVPQGEETKYMKKYLRYFKEEMNIDGVVLGVLLSDYQRLLVNEICDELGLKVFSPLWRKAQDEYLLELIDLGFKFIITSISVMGLSPKFIGRVLSREDVLRILELAKKYGFNPAFEGGEAETLVIDTPFFKYAIDILDFEIVRRGLYSWDMIIKKVKLRKK